MPRSKDTPAECPHGYLLKDSNCPQCKLERAAPAMPPVLPEGCELIQLDGGRYGCAKCDSSWDNHPGMCASAFVEEPSEAVAAAQQPGGKLDPARIYERFNKPGQPVIAKASFNPKDSVGVKKVPLSTVPAPVMLEVGLAMMEGARKYGRHNYRVIPVMASTYYDAVMARHMPAWWEGEDTDPDSNLSHITKAIASLVVLRDAMIQGTFMDDRPPKSPAGFIADLNARAAALVEKYPDSVPAFTEEAHGEQAAVARFQLGNKVER